MARRTGRKTDYSWGNFGALQQGIDLSVNQGTFGSTGLVILVPQTITRIRGRVALNLDATAVDERAMILCGLMIVSADGFATGDAPEISTNANDEASWLWTGALYVDSGGEAAVNENRLIDVIDIDTKAMRKVKPGQTLALVFQAAAGLVNDQAGTYDLTYWMHVLTGE